MRLCAGLVFLVLSGACAAAQPSREPAQLRRAALELPATSLTPAQALTHLLNRCAFGPSAQDTARVARLGVGPWLEEQLSPGAEPVAQALGERFPVTALSVAQATAAYPPPQRVARELGLDPKDDDDRDKLAVVLAMRREQSPQKLVRELSQARVLRAATAQRQLEEVLVDFWFNHFNVSADKGPVKWSVGSFERDAIRPHVFGTFRALLGATAKHPAMLLYLDNWSSVRDGLDVKQLRRLAEASPRAKGLKLNLGKGPLGLNENYARELLELHTVGVDAGYTQADVREAARALTGWSLVINPEASDFGAFAYRDFAHDKGEKQIFGLTLPAGGRQDDGEALLDYLARHPSTARFIALKLARRFVSDAPPPALVESLAQTFLATGGDLRAVYAALLTSKEFWAPEAYAAKTKTPLEFVVSAVRATGAQPQPQALVKALEVLGQPPYRAQPPTGYSELAGPWVNAGALVSRINFGLQLAGNRLGPLELPEVQGGADAVIDAMALRVLGRAPSEATRGTLKRALWPEGEEGAMDGERRPVDARRVAGLLLGAPEFQQQ